MKISIVILAVVGLVCGKPFQNGTLQDDLNDLMTLVPKDKVLEITLDYLYNDKEVQEIVSYVQSEEFPKIHKIVEYLQEYKDCLKFVNYHGVDLYAIVNEIHDRLGYPPFQPTNNTRTGVGINGLVDNVIAALPRDDINALVYQKKETSQLYKALDTVIRTREYTNLVDTVRTLPEWKELRDILQQRGVDVERYIERIKEFFGISRRGTRSLHEDVNDFIALVPTDKVLDILLDYLYNDEKVQKFVAYVQSEEFPMIHTAVEYLKQYKSCVKYIDDSVIDIYAIVNEVHDSLGYPPFQPTNKTRTGVGIHGLIVDVIAALPRDDMNALVYHKKETSELYKALVTFIQTPEFTTLEDTVRALPEWKELRELLLQEGLDVDHYIERILEFFGLSRLAISRIQDDLNDLMTLVPKDKVLEITLDYLYNDKEVQEIVAYVQSEEFPKIRTVVEYLQEYKDCLKFVTYHGVDLYAIVNEIHDRLGYPPFQPTNNTRTGVGINGLVDNVITALPRDDINALVYQKKETSQLYKALDTVIRTREYTNLVDTVRTLPEWKELRNILQQRGVDVERYIERIKEFFGLSRRGTRSLHEDVNDFIALVPTDKVLDILLDYLYNDEKVQKFVAYVQSEEFPKIHTVVEYLKQYKNCVKYIDDSIIDIYAIVNEIHDSLGYPPFQPTNNTRTFVGIHGLIVDVIAALPRDDINALVYQKKETSELYKALVTLIRTREYTNLVDTVRTLPEWKELRDILQEWDVDVDHIFELLRALFVQPLL